MRDLPPNATQLISTLIGALSNPWRQIVLIGMGVAAALALAYFLIERRLTQDLPPSTLTDSLPIALDIVLWATAVTAVAITLAWLATTLYLLLRRPR